MKKALPALLVIGILLGPFAILLLLGAFGHQAFENGEEACGQGPGPGSGRVWMPLAEGTYTPTSGYGMRRNPVTGKWRLHAGTDYGASQGTPIYAIAAGTVTSAGAAGGYGNLVVIEHTIDRRPIQSAYAHIRPGGILVKSGQRVAAGQKIAEVGTTGNSTGPHLHFEIRTKASSSRWASTDSAIWLKQHQATTPPAEGAVAPVPECPEEGAAPPTTPGELPGRPPTYRGPAGMVTDPSGTGGRLTGPTAHLWTMTTSAFPAAKGFCFAHRSDGGEHPKGRACDITPGNAFGKHPTDAQRTYGWNMATWMRLYSDELHIQYIIYQGKIWSRRYADQGWRTYYWRGKKPAGVTLGHYDHIHVSTMP